MHGNGSSGLWTVAGALLLALLAAPVAGTADGATADRTPAGDSLRSVLYQPSMNVFRRYGAGRDAMFAFYRDVLGFEQLQTFDVGGGTTVARFAFGGAELKLTQRVEDRSYVPGGVADATGLRLLTFFFPDDDALAARFREHGRDAPAFARVAGSDWRSALVHDPEGHPVELVVAPDAQPALYDTIEIGLTVRDLERSRAFYGDFVGLREVSDAVDRLSDARHASYRHGTTVVTLREFGGELPADTGTGGIQYVVTDVDAVAALTEQRGVTVDQPLSGLEGFDLRTIWLEDPDGITNYFAETGESRGASAGLAR